MGASREARPMLLQSAIAVAVIVMRNSVEGIRIDLDRE